TGGGGQTARAGFAQQEFQFHCRWTGNRRWQIKPGRSRAEVLPADAPAEVSDNLKAMKVRDLLTMTCGHDTEPKAVNGPSVKQFLAHPVPHAPGTHFQYNTMGSYTLSAIVTKVTGQTTLEFLKPRLFEPLGIENPEWGTSPEGNSL